MPPLIIGGHESRLRAVLARRPKLCHINTPWRPIVPPWWAFLLKLPEAVKICNAIPHVFPLTTLIQRSELSRLIQI